VPAIRASITIGLLERCVTDRILDGYTVAQLEQGISGKIPQFNESLTAAVRDCGLGS
jgi:hypothetical protein